MLCGKGKDVIQASFFRGKLCCKFQEGIFYNLGCPPFDAGSSPLGWHYIPLVVLGSLQKPVLATTGKQNNPRYKTFAKNMISPKKEWCFFSLGCLAPSVSILLAHVGGPMYFKVYINMNKYHRHMYIYIYIQTWFRACFGTMYIYPYR